MYLSAGRIDGILSWGTEVFTRAQAIQLEKHIIVLSKTYGKPPMFYPCGHDYQMEGTSKNDLSQPGWSCTTSDYRTALPDVAFDPAKAIVTVHDGLAHFWHTVITDPKLDTRNFFSGITLNVTGWQNFLMAKCKNDKRLLKVTKKGESPIWGS